MLNPFHRRLFAHLVDPGQVVGGLADQRRDVGILVGPNSVTFFDRCGGVSLELGHTARAGIQHRDLVGDKLEGVTVAGNHQHLETGGFALCRQCRENIVRFVVLHLHRLDAHRTECLLEQRNLTDELRWRLTSGSLVFGVFCGSERITRDVERDRHVGGLFGLQNRQKHGQEAVNRIRVLPAGGLERFER